MVLVATTLNPKAALINQMEQAANTLINLRLPLTQAISSNSNSTSSSSKETFVSDSYFLSKSKFKTIKIFVASNKHGKRKF